MRWYFWEYIENDGEIGKTTRWRRACWETNDARYRSEQAVNHPSTCLLRESGFRDAVLVPSSLNLYRNPDRDRIEKYMVKEGGKMFSFSLWSSLFSSRVLPSFYSRPPPFYFYHTNAPRYDGADELNGWVRLRQRRWLLCRKTHTNTHFGKLSQWLMLESLNVIRLKGF